MRKQLQSGLILLLLLYGVSSSLFAQRNWRWQNPIPQGNTLRGSADLGNNTIVFVGDAGTIIKSKDGGKSFERLNSGVRGDLYAVSFLDSLTGMAVGENGIILKTTNCGKSWQSLTSGRGDTLRGISILSLNIAIAVGDTGTILRSSDGGQNWLYQPSPDLKSNLNGIIFPTPDFGVIVGDSFPPFGGPPIISSGDSGISFSPFGSGAPNLVGKSLNSVWVPKADPNKAILVGDQGTIISTITKGQLWSTPISPVTVDIQDVWFFNDKEGFATGPNGTLLKTNDCGDSWSLIISPTQQNILTVQYPDSSTAFFGGSNGTLFKTEDGGVTFTNLLSGFRPNLTDVTFLDDSFGIAVGRQGSILRTTNAGDEWNPINSGTTDDFESITRDPNGSGLWAAGGTFGDSARIFFSGDSGISWTPQPIPSPFKLFNITFSDSLNGTAVGLSGVIYCTKNGGKSWQVKFSGTLNWLLDVEMPSDSFSYVVGGFGTILRSINQGITWTPLSSGTQEWLTCVSFLDDSIGMAAGNHGVILRTVDAGQSWQDVSFPKIDIDYTSLSLFRENKVSNKVTSATDFGVTIVGFDGTILYSPNGGDSWTEQDSKTKLPIWGSYFTDSLTGTAVGEMGMILRTDGLEDTTLTSLEKDHLDLTQEFPSLIAAYPNPARDISYIPFRIPYKARVKLQIMDLGGKPIAQLVNQQLTAGKYEYEWKIQGVPPGIYIIQLQVDKQIYGNKIMIYN